MCLCLKLADGLSSNIHHRLPAYHQGQIRGKIWCSHLNDGVIWGWKVIAEDRFGLINAERHFCRQSRITICPPLSLPPRVNASVGHHKVSTQQTSAHSDHKGHEGDFVELRTYQPTDHIRRIAWRASARRGKLLTQVFENTSERKFMLALDLSPFMQMKLLNIRRNDLALDLLHQKLKYLSGEQVGIVVFDHRILTYLPIAPQRKTLQRFNKIEKYLARPFIFDCIAETQDELWERLSDYLTWLGQDYKARKDNLEREPHLSISLRLKDTLNKEFMSQWLLNQSQLEPLSFFGAIGENNIDQRLRQFCYEMGMTMTPCLPRPLSQMHHGLSEVFRISKVENITHLSIISHSHRLQSREDLSLIKTWLRDRRQLHWLQTACTHPRIPKILSPFSSLIEYTPVLLTSESEESQNRPQLSWLT